MLINRYSEVDLCVHPVVSEGVTIPIIPYMEGIINENRRSVIQERFVMRNFPELSPADIMFLHNITQTVRRPKKMAWQAINTEKAIDIPGRFQVDTLSIFP